ncbi:MAG: HAD family hydrolase [Clostridiales bacterium]|nr:HAD family hydrolase [Clostridiales bacterium]
MAAKEHDARILLFDLDGTLLRDDKTLSQYTLETISKCKEQGYLIGISTSRGEQNCLQFLKKLKPDILISSGGALVRADEKIVCSSSFSAAETRNFIEKARNICGADCEITVDTLDAHYWNYKTNPKEQDKSWGESIYTDFVDFEHEALKICVEIHKSDMARKLCEYFSELDSKRFSDGDWYKFTKSGITKEKAILAVCEAYRADLSEIIAFGDDYADIGMLKLCGTGVAMGNAIQEVKDIADVITLSNEEDGVAVYLEKFLVDSGNIL